MLRRFHRCYTQRVGALTDSYVDSGRALGLSRLLFEIGRAETVGVSELRQRLGLDSAYVSRMLRTLESDLLVSVTPDATDGRQRVARLTDDGRAAWQQLDAGRMQRRQRCSSRCRSATEPNWSHVCNEPSDCFGRRRSPSVWSTQSPNQPHGRSASTSPNRIAASQPGSMSQVRVRATIRTSCEHPGRVRGVARRWRGRWLWRGAASRSDNW